VIIIDDCSNDDTEQMVRSIDDNRITYRKLESNKGVAATRNVGINLARGQYIAFLDSDDEYLPNKLQLQINKIEKLPKDVGIVYSGYFILYEPDKLHGKVLPQYKGNIFSTLLKHNCIGSATPLIRKECFNVCGMFDESLPNCEDWDLWIRFSNKYKLEYINEPLANIYTHGNQTSTSINSAIKGGEKLLEKYKDLISANRDTASYLLQRLGFLYFLNNQPYECFKYYLKSIKTDPSNLESYINLSTSLISSKLHIDKMKSASIRQANNITI